MKQTITITDPTKVKIGDKAYFKDCDLGFTVTEMSADSVGSPIMICNLLPGYKYWVSSSMFDYATREVEEPEWPHPDDNEMHVYLGADGEKYLYMPSSDVDWEPWIKLPLYGIGNMWRGHEGMDNNFHKALPLTELKLVPKDDES